MNSRQDIVIGILIPTFNRRSFLEQSLESALCQTYQNLKIIVIDNGSTDKTQEFMSAISDPRVSYVVNERNLGLMGSINKGVQLFPSQVTWCTVLPDDDILHLDYIKNMVEAVDRYSGPDVINCHRILIDEAGNALPENIDTPPSHESSLDYLTSRSKLRRKTYLTGIFFFRPAYDSIGGYPHFTTGLATDDAFIFTLSIRKGLYYAPQATAFVRIHSAAESNAATATGTTKHLETLQEFSAYVRNVSARSEAFDLDMLSRINIVLLRYVRLFNSYTILKELNSLAASAGSYRTKKVNSDALIVLTKTQGYPLLFSVKIYLSCLRIFPCLIFIFRFALACRDALRILRHRVAFS